MTGPATTSVMATEIADQPQAMALTLDRLLPLTGELQRLAEGRRNVLFVARGSSDNAAVYGQYLCQVHAGRPAWLAAPSLATHYRRELPLHDTLAVSISQSGETQEIVETQRWAAACGARTVAVTNGATSALAQGADVALVTAAGIERAVPATKTYTTQLVALAVLGLALGPSDGTLAAGLRRVPGEVSRLLARTDPAAAAEALAGRDRVIVSGRGFTLSTAQELSLKLLETCYLPSLGLSYADLLHGPIAVVAPATPAIIAAPPEGPMLAGLTELVRTLRGRGATVVGLGGDEAFAASAHHALAGPALPEALAPLATVVPGQVLVEALARRLGLDPDTPRGLAKVTQTDEQHPSPASRKDR